MNRATPLSERIPAAQALWALGDELLAKNDREQAYLIYTQAHDLIMDCPRLHEQAHRYLRPVTRLRPDRIEYLTDTLLLWLAPLGVFEAIAWAQKSRVRQASECRRAAA